MTNSDKSATIPGFRGPIDSKLVNIFKSIDNVAAQAGFRLALSTLRMMSLPSAYDRSPDVRRVQNQIAYAFAEIETEEYRDS